MWHDKRNEYWQRASEKGTPETLFPSILTNVECNLCVCAHFCMRGMDGKVFFKKIHFHWNESRFKDRIILCIVHTQKVRFILYQNSRHWLFSFSESFLVDRLKIEWEIHRENERVSYNYKLYNFNHFSTNCIAHSRNLSHLVTQNKILKKKQRQIEIKKRRLWEIWN